MDFDLDTLNSHEARAIIGLIHAMRCTNPLAKCGLCDAVKFCAFLTYVEEKCKQISERNAL